MESQARIYWETLEGIENKLNKENKNYMTKVKGYMLVSSLFHDADEAMVEHLYNIYLDVYEGQKNGLSAEDFLGHDPKSMADELLHQLPPLTVKKALELAAMMAGCYMAFQLLAEFAGTGQIGLNWGYLFGVLLVAIGLPLVFFLLLKNVIYQTVKWKIWTTYICIPVLFFAGISGGIWMNNNSPVFLLPHLWSILLAIVVLFITGLYRKEKLVRYIFLPVLGFYFASGLLQVYVNYQGMTGNFWNKWLPTGVLVAGYILFWVGSALVLLMDRKKK